MPKRATAIRSADDQIEAATRHLVDLDRKLAKLQRSRSRTSASVKLARQQRDQARMALFELIELAEMPVEFMGWA
jgi:DNA-nicking Smr family endonuclease